MISFVKNIWHAERQRQRINAVCRKYRELGGRFVTLGSDAHRVSAVGNYFARAVDFVRELGLTVVTFRERKLELLE